MRRSLVSFLLLVFVFFVGSCAEQESTRLAEPTPTFEPTFYDGDLLSRYAALSDSGYGLLEEGKTDEAIAVFTVQHEMIPEGKWGAYNVACAYGRTGRLEDGFDWLERAVEGGWDDPQHLQGDPDLESLKDDPRFAKILERVERTNAERTASFANGLPDLEAPRAFEISDSLDSWMGTQMQALYEHGRVWHNWQLAAARLNVEARRHAGERQLRAEDPEFDEGLARIRALGRVFSMYESWGSISDGITHEAEAYLSGNPPPEGRNEAHYRAAVASYMRKIPRSGSDPDWNEMAAMAREHIAAIDGSSDRAGGAAAIMTSLALEEAGKQREAVYPEVRAFAEQYGDDERAHHVAALLFREDFLRAVWPVDFAGVDLDGSSVELSALDGKLVLIDFWATWCGPCLRELPHLIEARQRFASRGLEIVSISLDYGDRLTVEEYRDWIGENGMAWRHIYDQQAWDGPLVKSFLVRSIPSPILISRDGKLLAIGEACRGEQLLDTIEKAL